MVVTECHGHCVTIFSHSGKILRSFGRRGTGQEQFRYPCGVAVDGEENIFVVDTCNNRIQKFTAQGKFLTAVGTQGIVNISGLIFLVVLHSMLVMVGCMW